MVYNKYQTQLTDEVLAPLPDEVKEQLFEFINTVPFIRNCISSDKKRAMDLERDDKGRIIVDVTKPHILENMDYFRQAAIFYQKNKCYTFLKPNPNPNSEYGKWIRQERDRCWNGMVRESDGEWITGYMYFYLNYFPIVFNKQREKSKIADRVIDFGEVWEGVYYAFHYIDQMRNGGIYNDFKGGQHGAELARRMASKSYMLGSIATHNFILGENRQSCKKVNTIITASKKEYLTKDGTLNKFISAIDFIAENTQFPRRRLKESIQEMVWTMGYKDAETNINHGTQNSVLGVAADEEGKMRGKRGHILVDEFGSFPGLSKMYNVWLPCVQEGDITFAMIFLVGTAGDKESDFQGASELMYNPNGYNLYALPNVYDKEGSGKRQFVYFFPAYINRKGCYDHDGNSDVIKALIEILMNRWKVKHNSSDPFSIVKTIAEQPITPSEAIIKIGVNIFPVTDLGNRLAQLDNEPNLLNEIYVGSLIQNGDKIEFKPDGSTPIRDYPIKKTDNDITSIEGAIEIITMPEIDKQTGKLFANRYIAGLDPYENDQSDDSTSLGSMFVLDLFTDKIVAEYTGRPLYAEDFYENVRKICLFYNAVLNYECNKKGVFAYFSKMNCLYLLTDTFEYLRDKMLVKSRTFGNTSKGTTATLPINNYAKTLLRNWLLMPVTLESTDAEGKPTEITMPNLYTIRNRALIRELMLFNPNGNFDRISSMGMLMLLREDRMVTYGGDIRHTEDVSNDYVGNDDFFTRNYDKRFKSQKFD